jgi:branched-chain amino acid transport system ATP-binding protein
MSVLDNMLLAAPGHPGERLAGWLVSPFAARRREREARARALELLETFDLSGYAGEYAGTLSGGQRKLLELARALMLAPRLVLLDEPLAGVNPTLARRLLEHIEELRTRDGTTVLFVEHDMEVVMNHSDRVIVMAQGRVIADGPAEDVRTNQTVVEAYLGKLVVD